MKTILAVMVALSLCVGASAQKKFGGGFYHSYGAPRVVIAPRVGFGYGYPAVGFGFGYPFFGYPYYGYPNSGYRGNYGYGGNSAKLALQIQSIKLDYKAQIKETRHNKSISHSERRAQIRNLKNEREQAIIAAQENVRRGRMNNYPNRSQNNNYQNQRNQNNGKDDSISPSSDTHS